MQKLIKYLSGFVAEKRFQNFQDLINYRTRYITVVLEDIFQPHNASAVLRTCDCFGIQDVHIIEDKNQYTINPDVALGASKWLSLYKHSVGKNISIETLENLREKGYRIVATTPNKDDVNLEHFDLKKGKIALFFGTELNGLSNTVIDNADEYLNIPIFGFTESFNISVSAAIILHHLSNKLRNSKINWELSENEKSEILLTWLRSSIKKVEGIEKDFLVNPSLNNS